MSVHVVNGALRAAEAVRDQVLRQPCDGPTLKEGQTTGDWHADRQWTALV